MAGEAKLHFPLHIKSHAHLPRCLDPSDTRAGCYCSTNRIKILSQPLEEYQEQLAVESLSVITRSMKTWISSTLFFFKQ